MPPGRRMTGVGSCEAAPRAPVSVRPAGRAGCLPRDGDGVRESSDDRRSIGMDRDPGSRHAHRSARVWAAMCGPDPAGGHGDSHAQGPQFDVGAPPGAAGGASTVGQPLGSADFPDFGTPSIAPFSGKPGPGGQPRPGELTRRRPARRCSGLRPGASSPSSRSRSRMSRPTATSTSPRRWKGPRTG